MSKKFFTDIKNIRTAIDTKKLVVFAGAGISIDAGIPSWNSLIEEMKSEIELPTNEYDYLRIAQMYFNERQQKEYIEKVRNILKHKKIKHNQIHEEIFQLNPEHILTTNYDDLLEQVIKKRTLPFSVISKDNQFPYASNTNLLVKIHGDLDDTDIVLKEDDYINYSLNHPLIEGFIKSMFASKIILFVGYSFSDYNLKMIIQTVRNILGSDFQQAYLLSIDEKFHPIQREYLKNKGINVVNYFDAINNSGDNYITSYLNGENALKENYFLKGENLTDKGQYLLNFLRFLSTYDKFNEPLSEKNVIDQIYLSLDRFSEFTSLPPDFVANLYPFNTSKKYVHNIEGNSLLTVNKNLENLFFNQLIFENEEIKFNPPSDLKLTKNQIEGYEEKLKTIIKKLNFSSIFFVIKENEKPDSFGYKGWSNEYKKLQYKSSPKCDCLNCRLERLELADVIKEVFNSNVNETTSVQFDLQVAYTHYKLGNFKQSCNLFDEIANKAWQTGKYFSYYIAKRNVKTLRNLVNFYERNLKEEEKKKLFKLMEDIDFDKLLFQIPYIGESEYKLLKIIRDDEVLTSAEKIIEDTLTKIIDVYDGYKRGTSWSMSQYYPQIVQVELFKIISFYTNNFIVIDEFINFTKVCRKAIEAFLVSYATSEEYTEKMKEFNKLFFDVAVFYGDPKEIKSLTQKYEINDLKFNEESLPEIIKSVNNFLNSFFETTMFGKNTYSNKVISNQISNDFFEDKCRQKFNNIFLLLSRIELKKEISEQLIENLVHFLTHESFLYGESIEYLRAFINRNSHLFSKSDFENLLQVILRKMRAFHDSGLFKTIASAFKKNNLLPISDRNLILRILSECETYDKKSKVIVSLWSMSDANIRPELKEIIVEKLSNKFDSDLYTEACFEDIIDYNDYFERYIAEIDKTKNGGYTLQGGKPKMQSLVFIKAMIFIYHMKVSCDDKRLKAFSNLTDYMEFYLFPETFDYKKFKVEWLLIAPREIFFERFKKIPEIKEEIERALKKKYDNELAKILITYF